MRFYQNIKEIEQCVKNYFNRFGINKLREITRIIYEISKREGNSFLKIAGHLKGKKFSFVKAELLRRRYPESFEKVESASFYLPKLEIRQEDKARIENYNFYPKTIYVEKEIRESYLVSNFRKTFPKSEVQEIQSLKQYIKDSPFNINAYNKRTEKVFIVKEKYDFIKACPCTQKAVACGYDILNIGFGCPYECVYCFLQGYQNFPGIIIPANIKDYLKNFKLKEKNSGLFETFRIGSGEFTDSLVFDEITGFSIEIIDYFTKYPNVNFEFKTKSKNIKNILDTKPSSNIVISWSLNPEKIIKENEFYTVSLKERIESASKCAIAGFSVGFHFDPIIYYDGWQKDYEDVINKIFENVLAKSIKWISLGTLRMTPDLKKVIENRFPQNKILDSELILGYDGKLRYNTDTRILIYNKMIELVKLKSKTTTVYLCMEPKDIWSKSNLIRL